MTIEQYTELSNPAINGIITVGNLNNKSERTLLYGYTCNRDTWHVYIKDNNIITVMYEYNKPPVEVKVDSNFGFVPDKRLYPARCDFEFCSLLRQLEVYLPFTTFEYVDLNSDGYYGETL